MKTIWGAAAGKTTSRRGFLACVAAVIAAAAAPEAAVVASLGTFGGKETRPVRAGRPSGGGTKRPQQAIWGGVKPDEGSARVAASRKAPAPGRGHRPAPSPSSPRVRAPKR